MSDKNVEKAHEGKTFFICEKCGAHVYTEKCVCGRPLQPQDPLPKIY